MSAGVNEILPFAIGSTPNVDSQVVYAALPARQSGFQTGTAISAEMNKTWRQSAFMAAGLAQWLANQGVDVPDDTNLAGLTTNLTTWLRGAVIPSIAALRTRSKTGTSNCFVTGYYAANDGGGGEYFYDATDTTTADNNGSIIVGADGGRWKLVVGRYLTPEQFGAKGDGTTNDYTAIANAIAAITALVGQNTGDLTQRRRYLSLVFTRKNYKISTQVVVSAGVNIVCDGGMIQNLIASTTTFAMVFNAGSHCSSLNLNANGGCGVQFGQASTFMDSLIGDVYIAGAGTATSIIGCRFLGTRFTINSVVVEGGNIGIDFGNGASAVRVVSADSIKSVKAVSGMRFAGGTEHISLILGLIDSPSLVGLYIDGARSISGAVSVFGDDTSGVTPCTSGYAINFGATGAVSDLNLNLTVNNTAITDVATGTALLVANTSSSNINLNASRATLTTGNAHRIVGGVVYGSGNAETMTINIKATTGVTPIAGGTPIGNIAFGGKLQSTSEVRTAPAISGGTLTLDLRAANLFDVTLNSNITNLVINNPAPTGNAQGFTLVFTNDGTARAVTWPASIKWPNSIAPVFSITSGKKDTFVFLTTDGGANYGGFIAGQYQ